MSENKLNVIDLHKRYGEHEVLKGVSLQANAGDVISIIGSSGSGKSTFLRCINFLEKPSEGSIVVSGQTINLVRDKDGQLNTENTMSENKLNVIDLHKRYGEHEVLKGVSLQANAGDVISIIGSSGSGKSTFLRCINFLEKPSEGSIVVSGQTINLVRDKDGQLKVADKNQLRLLRTRLTMVFQHFNLWSHMTVLENVMEAPIQVLGLSKQEARERAVNRG